MNRFGLLLLLLLLGSIISYSQCSKLRVKEINGVGLSTDQFVVTDSIVFHYDKHGNLIKSESHSHVGIEGGVRFTTFYVAKGDTVIREKVVTENAFVVIELFMSEIPSYSCTERKVVNSAGKLLALEDMSETFYGIKNWEGVDSTGHVYCKYQIGPNVGPDLFYKYRLIDGIWETDVISIMTANEHGDYERIQNIQVAGYGYNESYYKFEYDQCGNWVKKYAQGVSGKHHLIGIRELDYSDK